MRSEIVFEVTQTEEGGYRATALGYCITTRAATLEELRELVRDDVDEYFDDPIDLVRIIRLHAVGREAVTAH